MLRWFLLLALISIPALHACGGPTFIVQEYPGAVRAPETISVIRVNGQETIVLVSLDGEDIATRVPDDARLHVEVLPGKHTLTIGDLSDTSEPARTASFVARAGKIYRPVMQAHAARVYEVNPETDALLSDVTLADQYPRKPTPRIDRKPAPEPTFAVESEADRGDASVMEPDSSRD